MPLQVAAERDNGKKAIIIVRSTVPSCSHVQLANYHLSARLPARRNPPIAKMAVTRVSQKWHYFQNNACFVAVDTPGHGFPYDAI